MASACAWVSVPLVTASPSFVLAAVSAALVTACSVVPCACASWARVCPVRSCVCSSVVVILSALAAASSIADLTPSSRDPPLPLPPPHHDHPRAPQGHPPGCAL